MSALLRVMYAPLDYIHPDYFPAAVVPLAPVVQQAVNHTLIQRFSLATKLDFSLKTSDFSKRLVADWHLIPQVAYLLGCKLARGSLAVNGKLAELPVNARRFVELPVACPACYLAEPVTKANIELCGAHYLYLLQQHLPSALGQRLKLMFSTEKQVVSESMVLNRSLLTFAFDYAKNSSN